MWKEDFLNRIETFKSKFARQSSAVYENDRSLLHFITFPILVDSLTDTLGALSLVSLKCSFKKDV